MFLFRDFSLNEKSELRSTLKQIYGVGWHKAWKITDSLGFRYPYPSNNLSGYCTWLLLGLLKKYVISKARIVKIDENRINNLLILESYRGWRHRLSLPVRGQRTRTNSATQRRKRIHLNEKI